MTLSTRFAASRRKDIMLDGTCLCVGRCCCLGPGVVKSLSGSNIPAPGCRSPGLTSPEDPSPAQFPSRLDESKRLVLQAGLESPMHRRRSYDNLGVTDEANPSAPTAATLPCPSVSLVSNAASAAPAPPEPPVAEPVGGVGPGGYPADLSAGLPAWLDALAAPLAPYVSQPLMAAHVAAAAAAGIMMSPEQAMAYHMNSQPMGGHCVHPICGISLAGQVSKQVGSSLPTSVSSSNLASGFQAASAFQHPRGRRVRRGGRKRGEQTPQ